MAKKIIELDKFAFKHNGQSYPATVPGDILNDLLINGIVKPFDRGEDFENVLWVQESDFEYSCIFDISKNDFNQKIINLSFLGIDTFSKISINGTEIGETDNMFLRYDYDIKSYVKEGRNEITVSLRSPTKELKKHKNDKYVCVFNNDRLFLRKAQCHYGWDWAPELAGYGIYLPVILTISDGFAISDVQIKSRINGDITVFTQLSYNVRTHYKDYKGRDTLEIVITNDLNKVVAQKIFTVFGEKNIINLNVPNPELWWANGYGKPNLYNISISLKRDGNEICKHDERFGIREIQINETPIKGEDRLNFRVNLNGKDIYCKGSNWVPLDFMTGCIADERYKRIIRQAVDCNMNMLRVWGGGIYEKDSFYKYCDECGIMLMQEFMISCSDIPEDEIGFANQLIKESEYQVRRLKNHPSIVLWSGGNERATSFNIRMDDFNNFCSDIVFRGTVGKFTSVPYIDHSPFSYTDMDDDEFSGDSHSSCLDKTIQDLSTYHYRDYINFRVPAFVSECAALGPARLRSMKQFLKTENLWPLGKVWEKRLRDNPSDSNGINFTYWIQRMVEQLFGKPDNIEDFIKKGMVAQYEILLDEIMFVRANSQYNGGFLNWMMGDIWGTGTWSVVDYLLEEKGGYYGMKKAFEPFAVGFIKDLDKKTKLTVINDTQQDFFGKVVFGAKTLDGNAVNVIEQNVNVPIGKSIKIEVDNSKGDYLFATANATHATYFPTYWKEKKFSSDYTYQAQLQPEGISLSINAKSFLRKVFITLPYKANAVYSDNLFDMQAGENKVVFIKCKNAGIDEIIVKTFTDIWEE